MGSGKGAPEYWVAVVKPGRVLFEIAGVREEVAKEALTRAAFKLPVRCRIVARETVGVVEHDEEEEDRRDAAETAQPAREFAEGETIELGKKAELRAQLAAEGTLAAYDEQGPPVEGEAEAAADVPATEEGDEREESE